MGTAVKLSSSGLMPLISPMLGGYSVMEGRIKFPTIWYSSPTPFIKILIFFPKISVPFPSFPIDNLPYSHNIIEQMILLPLTLFYTWSSSQKPLHFLPFWNSSPKDLINFPLSRGEGNEELYTPLVWCNQIGSAFDREDVVLDSFNKASRDEDSILDQINKKQILWIFIMMILIFHNITGKWILTWE